MISKNVNFICLALTFSKRQILSSSKFKDFANDNSEIDESVCKLSKRVENTVGKGEIARYEQFLLFPLCFQDAYRRHLKSKCLFGKGLILLCSAIHQKKAAFFCGL